MVESIDVILSTQLTVEAEAQILVIKDHSKLDNLDYENSGHTGFVSKDYADTQSLKKVDKADLYDANGIIKETLLPEEVKNVFEFNKQINGSTFMDQILESDIGSMLWIATDKTYTGDTYYRKFVINVDGSQANLILLDPKEQTIYICKTDSNCFRWSGTDIVEISKSIGLGETSSTAYAGDKGKSNADTISELQNTKMDRTDVIDYNNLNNKPIILIDLIPSEESNNVYQYTGNEEISGIKNGDLFIVKKKLLHKKE